MGKLDGRVCIVTGAARGIGKAIGLRLAEEGAKVVFADIDCQEAEAASRRPAAKGAWPSPCRWTSPAGENSRSY